MFLLLKWRRKENKYIVITLQKSKDFVPELLGEFGINSRLCCQHVAINSSFSVSEVLY